MSPAFGTNPPEPSQQDLIGDYHTLRDLFGTLLDPGRAARLVIDGGDSGPLVIARLPEFVLLDFYNDPQSPPIANQESLLSNHCRVNCENPFEYQTGFAVPELARLKEVADLLLRFRTATSVEEILAQPGTGLFSANSDTSKTWGTLSVRGVFPVEAAALLSTHDISCSLLEKIAATFEAGTEQKFPVGKARIAFRASGRAEIDIQSSVEMLVDEIQIQHPVRKVICYDLLEEKLVGFACYDSSGQLPVSWDSLDYESMGRTIIELYNSQCRGK